MKGDPLLFSLNPYQTPACLRVRDKSFRGSVALNLTAALRVNCPLGFPCVHGARLPVENMLFP